MHNRKFSKSYGSFRQWNHHIWRRMPFFIRICGSMLLTIFVFPCWTVICCQRSSRDGQYRRYTNEGFAWHIHMRSTRASLLLFKPIVIVIGKFQLTMLGNNRRNSLRQKRKHVFMAFCHFQRSAWIKDVGLFTHGHFPRDFSTSFQLRDQSMGSLLIAFRQKSHEENGQLWPRLNSSKTWEHCSRPFWSDHSLYEGDGHEDSGSFPNSLCLNWKNKPNWRKTLFNVIITVFDGQKIMSKLTVKRQSRNKKTKKKKKQKNPRPDKSIQNYRNVFIEAKDR